VTQNSAASSILLLIVVVLLVPACLLGQGTTLGTIRGTVVDASGAVVPGAKVVITDIGTNLATTLTTDNQGNYEAPELKYGRYKVTVSFEGFNNAEIVGVDLIGGEVKRVDAKLAPKTSAEAVTVTSEAGLIQTENQTITNTLNSQQIVDLPRDSRDIYDFLYLTPNITFNPDDGFKFLGAQSWGANFTLDGQRATGAGFGEPIGGQPSLESIGELTVLSNSFNAEYAGISNIRVTTKRGGSAYHGSLFYDNRNSALAAWSINDKIAKANFNPTFATPTFFHPSTNFTEIGGSFGGPLPIGKKKRTFFMGSYERRWDVAPIRFRGTSVAHASVVAGDFTKIADSRKPVVPAGVTLTAAEIANNTLSGAGQRFTTIPARLMNPFTTAIIKNYFPDTSPNAPINSTNGRTEYNATNKGLITRDLVTSRIDHDFNERDRFYVTYNGAFPDGSRSLVGQPYKSLGTLVAQQTNNTLSLSHIHVFNPRFINEARGGFNSQNRYVHDPNRASDFLKNIGFQQADLDAYAAVVGKDALDSYGQVGITYGPYTTLPGGGRNADRPRDDEAITFGDTISWITPRHSIRGGFDIVHNHATDGFVSGRGNVRGLIVYSGSDTNPLARFLLGLPADNVRFNTALRPAMDVTNWEHGYFVQDDFRVSKRLTLNLGLRYELLTPFIDKNDLMVNFDPSVTQSNGTKGVFIVPAQKTLAQIDPRMITYGAVAGSSLGLGRGLVHTDKNNFAPRLGGAFRLTERTSIRGGWGMFFPTSAAQGIRDAMESSPFNQGRTKTNCTRPPCAGSPDPAPLLAWPRPFSGGALPVLGGQPTINAIPFDLQAPRIDQFNVTVERELGFKTAFRISYLGTRMHGLIAGYDLNEIPPNDIPFGTTTGDGVTACDPVGNGDCQESPADAARRPYSNLGDFMLQYRNIGTGRAHAMQMEVNHRYAGGLVFSASYTLLDEVSSGVDANSSLGGTLYNQFRPGADTGPDPFVSRHRFVAYGTYDVPVGRHRQYLANLPKIAEGVIGGWQLSFNMFAKTGTGYTPWWECNGCGTVTLGNIASGSSDPTIEGGFGGGYRATVSGDPYRRTGDATWDRSAFGFPVIGAQVFDNPSNAPRGFLRGPGAWGVNFGFTKNFHLTERIALSFRGVLDNAFNHPLRLIPGDSSTVADLGSFDVGVNPKTLKLLPLDPASINPNPDFGRFLFSNSQEGLAAQRLVRLSLRLTF
jgi:carboxypeptidase family protein/TonB-dependent receptor-like protein